MAARLLRGRVLSFTDEPRNENDHASYVYHEDGAIVIENGLIKDIGDYAVVRGRAARADITDYRAKLLLPGFIDAHNHMPQIQVIGSYGARLIDWLNNYTFPAELAMADDSHARAMATAYLDAMLKNGITTVAAYCSVHKSSADILFQEAQRRNMRIIAGKVMMDRNAPGELTDTAQQAYDDSKWLIEKWHGKGRALYAITPRFAITSTPAQLEAAGSLLAQYPDCYLQTHLSESREEISWTSKLFRDARDYLDVYETFGLAGQKSLFGHCIHLSGRERAALAQSRSVAVFCPTSNLFIGSGLFDMKAMQSAGVRIAVATDIGGGTSCSMLQTMDAAYKVQQLQQYNLNPLLSFYMLTLGNARCLSLSDRIGTLEPGSEADICVLDSSATPLMALRMQTVKTLAQELFILQTMGDDRAISAVYVNGELVSFGK